jgi:lysophospholipase L1-like esterase
MTETPPPSDTPVPGTLRVLALGDSYTIGEGVDDAERWPVRLAAALRAEGIPVADPEIIATTGWTVAELDAGIDVAQPAGPYALVTLLIGVNDQYRGGDAGAYRTAFRAMLARATGFAGGDARRVVVVSIPDWSVTPFAAARDRAQIASAIDAFNTAAQAEAQAAGARWADVTAVSRETGAVEVAPDGLHPSGAQYALWTGIVLPHARAALADETQRAGFHPRSQ